MRRATWLRCWKLAARDISIHALLAESDPYLLGKFWELVGISIHALLAESDKKPIPVWLLFKLFLSTLSLRRATVGIPNANTDKKISIHALLAESDVLPSYYTSRDYIFLSTLSLRRATATPRAGRQAAAISIHALLAESDYPSAVSRPHAAISIHALLAESDFFPCVIFAVACQFLSTLSLRRATDGAAFF